MRWALVFCVMATGGCVSGANTTGAEGVYREQRGAVVTVVTYDPDKAMPQVSSGFFAAVDRVVTARHALAGADRAEVRTADGQTIAVRGILAENQTMDVVMVEVALGGPRRGARLAEEPPRVGQKLVAIGAPLGLESTVSEGLVSGIREVPDAGQAVQHTVAVSPGSSGGPLFDLSGRVVAIQTGTITAGGDRNITAGQSLNFAVPARYIRELVPGSLRPLGEARKEVAADWVPAVTRNVDRLSLRPFMRDDFGGAAAYFQKRVEQLPQEADAWFRLGLCRERMSDWAEAVSAYRKCLELDGKHYVAGNNLGQVHLREGRNREAAAAFRGALAAKSDYVEALTGLAMACNHLKQHSEALEAAEKAVRLNEKQTVAHLALGQACAAMGDRERAMKQVRVLEKLDGNMAEQLKKMISGSATTRKSE